MANDQNTPFGPEDQFQYYDEFDYRVGFGRRFGAALLDLLIVTIVSSIAMLFTGTMDLVQEHGIKVIIDPELIRQFSEVSTPMSLLISFLYYFMEVLLAATPGKLILGIRIASENRTWASYAKLFTRFSIKNLHLYFNLLALLTGQMIFEGLSILVFIIILFGFFFVLGARRQAFHDMIAGTAVYFAGEVKYQPEEEPVKPV
ncbi:MAG: RDD family protein [Candidatus Kapaibacterium sp.]